MIQPRYAQKYRWRSYSWCSSPWKRCLCRGGPASIPANKFIVSDLQQDYTPHSTNKKKIVNLANRNSITYFVDVNSIALLPPAFLFLVALLNVLCRFSSFLGSFTAYFRGHCRAKWVRRMGKHRRYKRELPSPVSDWTGYTSALQLFIKNRLVTPLAWGASRKLSVRFKRLPSKFLLC